MNGFSHDKIIPVESGMFYRRERSYRSRLSDALWSRISQTCNHDLSEYYFSSKVYNASACSEAPQTIMDAAHFVDKFLLS